MTTFERKVLRGVFGGIESTENWRKWYNKEFIHLFGDLGILSFVRISQLNWICHVNAHVFTWYYPHCFIHFWRWKLPIKSTQFEFIYPFCKFQDNAPLLQSLVCHFLFCLFLGMFTKLWKATVSFVVSVCLSVRVQLLGSHRTDFHENWYLSIFF